MLPPGPPRSQRYWYLARWLRRPIEVLEECREKYGDTFKLDLGLPSANLVVTGDPDMIRDVFAAGPDDMHAGAANIVLKPFLGGHSLLLLDGREHIRQRKLLLPPFHGERMQAYGKAMIDATNDTIDRWPVGAPFTFSQSMREVTLDIILRTVFGLDDPRSDPLFEELTHTLDDSGSPFMLLPWMQVDLGPLTPWGRFQAHARRVDVLLHAAIRARRAGGTRGRTDVLSMLLDARDEAGEAMTDLELRDQLITLLVAGHETTATGLSWAFRYLLEQRDTEARLRDEVANVRDPEAIAALPYLDAVVREALRVRPVIPMVGRRLQKALRVGNWELPRGVFVAPSIWLAHHREQVFASPMKFMPERFLGKKPGAYEWFPFGGGIRRCIGMAFALYEMKMSLATIVQRTSLSLAPSASIDVVRRSITLAPADGLRVVVRERRRPSSSTATTRVASESSSPTVREV
jgi:cytochrome P450